MGGDTYLKGKNVPNMTPEKKIQNMTRSISSKLIKLVINNFRERKFQVQVASLMDSVREEIQPIQQKLLQKTEKKKDHSSNLCYEASRDLITELET